jgi:Domain of unknown function (DUF4209)
LWILADACSAALRPESLNEPFAPFAVIEGRRSTLPDDLSPSALALLSEMLGELDNNWIRGRVADILWLLGKPRNFQHALTAIDAYVAIPLEPNDWPHDGALCWHRATTLAKQLGKGAVSRLADIETALLSVAAADPLDSSFFRVSVGRLLHQTELGRDRADELGESFAATGAHLATELKHDTSRVFYEHASLWFSRSNNTVRLADTACAIAESFVSEAETRGGGMLGLDFYEHAIQTYRRVPKDLRAARNVDARVEAIHLALGDSGKEAVKQMRTMSTEPIDITGFTEAARASVRGKTPLDALVALASLYGGARRQTIEASSKNLLEASPLQALFGSTHLARDGRVVAKTAGAGFDQSDTEESRSALWAKMVSDYGMEISFVVQAKIAPALQTFVLEHRVREGDLHGMLAQSPIVPEGRAPLIAKALYAGFEFDFPAAIHMVAPQLEHLVRHHLKSNRVKTTTLSADGVENENGLSALVDLPETPQIFGEDIAFEMKALFCDAHGPNLRNEVAHGLLSFEAAQSLHVIYAWWFLLRVTFIPFWNELHARKAPAPASDVPGEQPSTPNEGGGSGDS